MRYCCKFWGMLVAPEAVGEDAPDSFYQRTLEKKDVPPTHSVSRNHI